MNYLLYFYPANGDAAKAFAAPLRHRRHRVFLREIPEWLRERERESCDAVILMLAATEEVPGELATAYDNIIQVAPGDEPWSPGEDELKAMSPLNKLRHDAAMLGIEVNPAFDAERLVELIGAAEGEEAAMKAREEAEALRIEREADAAQAVREGKAPAADVASATGGAEEAGATSESEGGQDATPASDPLAGVDVNDATALREFAKARGFPVNPNKRTSAAKLLATIKIALGENNGKAD